MSITQGILDIIKLFPEMDIVISSDPSGGSLICVAILGKGDHTPLAQLYIEPGDVLDPSLVAGFDEIISEIAADIAAKKAAIRDKSKLLPKPVKIVLDKKVKGKDNILVFPKGGQDG